MFASKEIHTSTKPSLHLQENMESVLISSEKLQANIFIDESEQEAAIVPRWRE